MKFKNLFNLALVPTSLSVIAFSASCKQPVVEPEEKNKDKDNKQKDDNNTDKKPQPSVEPVEPDQPKPNPTPDVDPKQPDTNPETPIQPDQPRQNNDEQALEGKELNGLNITKYGFLLDNLNINKSMLPSQVAELLKTFTKNTEKYNVSGIEVISYSDKTGDMTFRINGNYGSVNLSENVTISGLSKIVSYHKVQIEFNLDKLKQNKTNLENLLNQNSETILGYITSIKLLNGQDEIVKTITDFQNSDVEVSRIQLVKENNQYKVDLTLKETAKVFENNRQNNESVIVYTGKVNVEASYTDVEYLNYLVNNQLIKKEVDNLVSSYASSYFARSNEVDLTTEFFGLNENYRMYQNEAISVKSNMAANDLTGTLYLSLYLEVQIDGQTITSEFVTKEITGFKALDQQALEQLFTVTISGDFKTSQPSLIDSFKANSQNFALTDAQYMQIVGNKNFLVLRESQDNTGIKSYQANNNNRFRINIGNEFQTIQQIYNTTTGVASGLYLNYMNIEFKQMDSFEWANTTKNKLNAKLHYTITFNIANSTSENPSEKQVVLNQHVNVYFVK
ncbi:lipoprotein 17-related variable surface protein [Mycoplasma nasistruthionis]|nr:lipoprotein 17-related variable surface protein [Mycoplasma nasistruthionis]